MRYSNEFLDMKNQSDEIPLDFEPLPNTLIAEKRQLQHDNLQTKKPGDNPRHLEVALGATKDFIPQGT